MELDWRLIGEYALTILSTLIIPFLVSENKPTGVVSIVNWLKTVLGLSGNSVRVLVLIVSVILAALIGLAEGQLSLDGFMSPGQFATMLAIIVASSQYWYGQLNQ